MSFIKMKLLLREVGNFLSSSEDLNGDRRRDTSHYSIVFTIGKNKKINQRDVKNPHVF